MSYTYLQEQGEVSSVECFSNIPVYVLSRLNLTAEKSCCSGSETESCQSSQSGMTCEPLMESLGEDTWTWFAGGSPALIYHKSSRTHQESKESNQGFGMRWLELPMRLDQSSCSLKTHLSLFDEDLDESRAIFPEWGMMQNGRFWAHATPELVIYGTDFGYWATPNARDWKDTPGMMKTRKDGRKKVDQASRQAFASLDGSGLFIPPTAPETWMMSTENVQSAESSTGTASVRDQQWTKTSITKSETAKNGRGLATNGRLSAEFAEWLMGLPIQWSALQPLETDKFQQWLNSHGKRS